MFGNQPPHPGCRWVGHPPTFGIKLPKKRFLGGSSPNSDYGQLAIARTRATSATKAIRFTMATRDIRTAMASGHQGTRGIRDTEPVRLAHLNIIPTGAQGTKTISTTRYVHNIIPSFSLSMAVKENPFLHHNHPTVFC